jgi:hypothetical protein
MRNKTLLRVDFIARVFTGFQVSATWQGFAQAKMAMGHDLKQPKGSDKRTHAINLHQPSLLAT